MGLPDLSDIEANGKLIVEGVGKESVAIYQFLVSEFAKGSVAENQVFQFMYRSFYRLDVAGLTPEFKSKYFWLLETSRNSKSVDIKQLTKVLYDLPNRKGQKSLQFSFVTKLANTVQPAHTIYDAEVASVFGFRPPHNYKAFDVRLEEYLAFYVRLSDIYNEILKRDHLLAPRQMFREMYGVQQKSFPDIKVLDFIFWSAGKLSFKAK